MTPEEKYDKLKQFTHDLLTWENAKNSWAKLKNSEKEKEADEKITFYEKQIEKLSNIVPIN